MERLSMPPIRGPIKHFRNFKTKIMNTRDPFAFVKNLKHDIPASIIVFLVAVPLCLGIAAASGVPLISGLIAGMIGGIIVTLVSGSSLGVSGPAAGLVAIVLAAQDKLGGLEFFFIATALAGVIQVILGLLRGGIIAYYFPNSVIKGMLAGIGIIIIMKMIPDAFGFLEKNGYQQQEHKVERGELIGGDTLELRPSPSKAPIHAALHFDKLTNLETDEKEKRGAEAGHFVTAAHIDVKTSKGEHYEAMPSYVIKGDPGHGESHLDSIPELGLRFKITELHPQTNKVSFEVSERKAFKSLGLVAGFKKFKSALNPASLIIAIVGLLILIIWEQPFMKRQRVFQLVQGPLVAVIVGILMNLGFSSMEGLTLQPAHLVSVPNTGSITGFFGAFPAPDWGKIPTALMMPQVYITALTIAVVASLETLLCVEATDKLDPWKRVTPTNRELYAQGAGNFTAGLIGGLPITQVIVRSSTNIQSGAHTKSSAFFHGLLLFFGTMLIPGVLNMIPMASLAAILFVVGFKLAKPTIWKEQYKAGLYQFLPFVITVLGIVIFDLLIGIGLGVVLAIFFILSNNLRNAYRSHISEDEEHHSVRIELAEDVSFLNKAAIQETLKNIPNGYHVVIDASDTRFMHSDVYDIIHDFEKNAETRNITVDFKEPTRSAEKTDVALFNERMRRKQQGLPEKEEG
jgi:MFS superfamily sulfate permease-like transporter